jgi:hypothetical protein
LVGLNVQAMIVLFYMATRSEKENKRVSLLALRREMTAFLSSEFELLSNVMQVNKIAAE